MICPWPIQLWNEFMIMVSLIHLYLLYDIPTQHSITICSKQPFRWLWVRLQQNRTKLVFNYVIACAILAIWPRMDGDRHCFYNNWISSVLVGRCLATIAEVSFMIQIGLALIHLTGETMMASFLVFINGLAQVCCWYSVLTKNQFGHVLEEMIWTGSMWLVMIVSMNSQPTTKDGKWFKRLAFPLGLGYISFMMLVDIPMYMQRYLSDTKNHQRYLTFSQGWIEIQSCQYVSRSEYWYNEITWMTLYFTVAVWISLWLSQSKM